MTTRAYALRLSGISTIYLAGPMTGIKSCNFPAFHEAARALRAAGFVVMSPAELDRPAARDRALASEGCGPDALLPGTTWVDPLARDLKIVCEAHAVVVLPGWTRSRGANLEAAVARALEKPVLTYPGLNPIRSKPRMPYEEDAE